MGNQFVPSRTVFDRATAYNKTHGHENRGFLSEQYGILPSPPPLLNLPESHAEWDNIVIHLPRLFQQLSLRAAFEELPVLPADIENLPDVYLCRASTIISMLAHAYYHVEVHPPDHIPESIQAPWVQIAERMGRPAPFLSYTDLILYNWKLRDHDLPHPFIVENMDLLVQTVGNREEEIFHLTQVEIAARFAPAVTAIIRAQEAAVVGDKNSLETELTIILDTLRKITEVTIKKISPNFYSETYVDPVVWAKTVAPFAVPVEEGLPGPSGTAAPVFHLLDAFFARPSFRSVLGSEAMHLLAQSPLHWQDLTEAIREVSVAEFINTTEDRYLQGLFNGVLDAFAGDAGFLGVHRLKAYGYLEIAFKAGRSVTIGGFKGLFKDRTWDKIDNELRIARNERYIDVPEHCYFALPREGEVNNSDNSNWTVQVTLDVSNTGMHYRPGDRIGVLPENSALQIKLSLDSLQAKGNEKVKLDRKWRNALQLRYGEDQTDSLSLEKLMRYGKLRPLTRTIAKRLYSITGCEPLRRIIHARVEDQWELWDILNIIYASGFDTRRFWKAESWDRESICRIILPETFRLYSIASTYSQTPKDEADLQLIVSGLQYESIDSPLSIAEPRFGTASNFLRSVTENAQPREHLSLRIFPAQHFQLPANDDAPVIMFAGGSGIAPFIGFIEERVRRKAKGENWLIFSTRTPDDLHHASKLKQWVADGRLKLNVVFSQVDASLNTTNTSADLFSIEDGVRGRVDSLIRETSIESLLWSHLDHASGGQKSYFYICGRTGFGNTVTREITRIIHHHIAGSDYEHKQQADTLLRQLIANGRFMQDIYPSYSGVTTEIENQYNTSEIVLHNNKYDGYWMVISGRVYDVSEFMHQHLGGQKIMIGSAGIDATRVFQSVMHHVNTEVEAMLGMYEIGVVRRLDMKQEWGTAIGPDGLIFIYLEEVFLTWVRYLYVVVELQNTLTNDFSVRERSTTFQEPPSLLTPLKLQILIEAHKRCINIYLDGIIGEDSQVLWSVTSGLCEPDSHIEWMQYEMQRINQTSRATFARRSPEIVWQMMRMLQRATGDERIQWLNKISDFTSMLEQEDTRLFEEIKDTVREGVMIFEQYEHDSIREGATVLMASIRRIPKILERYYQRITHRMITLDETLHGMLHNPDNEMEASITLDFPGHGMRDHEAILRQPTPSQEE